MAINWLSVLRIAPIGALLGLGAALPTAQEKPATTTAGDEAVIGVVDAHEQMKLLFGAVERRLRDIDRLLANASAGEGAGSGATRTTVDLVESSRRTGQQVLRDIDRILELADHGHPPGGT